MNRDQRHFSTWLIESGAALPGELAALQPPAGLTYGSTLNWLIARVGDGGIRNPRTLVATLESGLLGLRARWSEETGCPVVEVASVFPISVDSAAALAGTVFAGQP